MPDTKPERPTVFHIDRATVVLVGAWLQHIADSYGLDLS